MPIYFWKFKMSCQHKCKSSQRWSSVCRTNPRAEHWRGPRARCCCQVTPSSVSFGKKHKYKILFFFLPVSKAQDLYSTASSPSQRFDSRDTPESPNGKSPFFYSKRIRLLPTFLGLALQFRVFDHLIAQLPWNAISTAAAQSPGQGDIAHRFAVTIGIPSQEEQPPFRAACPTLNDPDGLLECLFVLL